MKKALIYLILFVFLFNSIGYYFLFELNKQIVRKEMQATAQGYPSRLTILTIADVSNDKEFQRIDEKEFRYKGAMYDIVRELQTGQTTVFICLLDTKETNLLAGLKKVNQNKLHFALWDHPFMFFNSIPCVDLSSSFSGKLIFPRIDIRLKSPILPTWSPPPEYS